ncbi:two-component system histidine kinase PnpS [Jeotgalibacillus campisalis]|uniref:histidine kinase n=1 Tax=Jeotgalibacillus campisalis TaxID=220754 RepID=A0A0C2VQK6_9BACL|nr:ATP-binding protein [Jeotgalibacillus campisalis]KIL46298.1 alkaline phosphatase [Jeotgalibacillus campisalis]
MSSFRTRLLFALISLIVLVLVGLGVLIGELFKSYYLNALHSRMEKEVQIVVNEVELQPFFTTVASSRFDELSDVLDIRILMISESSNVIYDSENNVNIRTHTSTVQSISEDDLSSEDPITQYQANENTIYYAKGVTAGETEGLVIVATKFDELQAVYRQIWIILGITLGVAMFIIILLGSRITNQYTKPIESATKVAIELAKGNYRARTYEDRVDETGMLSNAINVLARNLQEMVTLQAIQQDRLQTLIENMGSGLIMIDRQGYIVLVNRTFLEFFHLQTDEVINKRYVDIISDKQVREVAEEVFMTEQRIRKQIHVKSVFSKLHLEVYGAPIIGDGSIWQGIVLVFHDISELKKLEQMRKDFVANVSHEVKTPITSIKGFTETLLDGAMNDKEALESFLTIILKESDRLQDLIQDLLDLSKVEQQGFNLAVSNVSITDLLQEARAIMKQKADQKSMEILLDGDQNLFIEGDHDRLKQVFINLISNALTYSQPRGEIRLTVTDQTERVLIKVEDDGIGMEQEEIPRIFERFYRVDKARSRNSGGTGLGLAIVKHIVEVHHGEISVTSEPNKGTAFLISLPKKYWMNE